VVVLAAMLSISLGIFNLLPISPLDGGQMLVAVAEMLRGGKRLSMKVQGAVAAVGLTLIMVMVVSIMFIDIGRISEKPGASKEISKAK
jgi:regulator of sigma E protease